MDAASLPNWYVRVVIDDGFGPTPYKIGPCSSWTHARQIAIKWEAINGPNTAHVKHYDLSRSGSASVDRLREIGEHDLADALAS